MKFSEANRLKSESARDYIDAVRAKMAKTESPSRKILKEAAKTYEKALKGLAGK